VLGLERRSTPLRQTVDRKLLLNASSTGGHERSRSCGPVTLTLSHPRRTRLAQEDFVRKSRSVLLSGRRCRVLWPRFSSTISFAVALRARPRRDRSPVSRVFHDQAPRVPVVRATHSGGVVNGHALGYADRRFSSMIRATPSTPSAPARSCATA